MNTNVTSGSGPGRGERERRKRIIALVARRIEAVGPAKLAELEQLLSNGEDLSEFARSVPGGPTTSRLRLDGTGLGISLDADARTAALAALGGDTNSDDWVRSRVLGIVEAAHLLGVARATLDNWRRANQVLAFSKGVRNFVFPMAQFEGARPVEGLARLRTQFRNDEEAWDWLVTRNRMTGGKPPLERLRGGFVDEVVGAARGQFDFA